MWKSLVGKVEDKEIEPIPEHYSRKPKEDFPEMGRRVCREEFSSQGIANADCGFWNDDCFEVIAREKPDGKQMEW